MQTFLPFASFGESAKVLDNKRLGNQRVEAMQILRINRLLKDNEHVVICRNGHLYRWNYMGCPYCTSILYKSYNNWRNDGGKIKLENSPAVRMWRGWEHALAVYGAIICEEWINRGYKDNVCYNFFQTYLKNLADKLELVTPEDILFLQSKDYPEWFGRVDFHYSHQANLLRKDYDYYSKVKGFEFVLGYIDFNSVPYEWNREYWR